MWKFANSPFSGTQDSQRSSSGTIIVPSTANTIPQKSPSTPPTPFLRSRSKVRFALESDFAFDSKGEKHVPPLLPIESAIVQPNTPARNVFLSPNPNQCYRDDAVTHQKASNIHIAANPNDCYRLALRQIRLPTQPNEREDGAPIPLRGQYVTTIDDDPDDEDLINDPPPGLDDDPPTAMRKFAWAYAKGLRGLVMGVMDGLARGAGGGDGGLARYLNYGAVAHEGARR